MKLLLTALCTLIFFCLVAIFAAANHQAVTLNLLFDSVDVSLRWVIFILFCLGLFIGLLFGLLASVKSRLTIRSLRKKLAKLEQPAAVREL